MCMDINCYFCEYLHIDMGAVEKNVFFSGQCTALSLSFPRLQTHGLNEFSIPRVSHAPFPSEFQNRV